MISGLPPEYSYEEKCKEVKIETLEERRKIQDMAQTFKLVRGFEKINRILLFRHVDGGRTRQDTDPLNLKQGRSRLDLRKNYFTQRIINEWNKIPADIKQARNVAGFKAS
jgi:hypothetical protein